MKTIFILKARYENYDGSKYYPALGVFAEYPTESKKEIALFNFVAELGKSFSAHYKFIHMTVMEVPFYD